MQYIMSMSVVGREKKRDKIWYIEGRRIENLAL